jgi:hypothetical protein
MHYLPIVVAALAAWAIGGLWYSPVLFGKAWMKGVGLDINDPRLKAEMQRTAWLYYLSVIVAAAVTATVFFMLRNALGIESAVGGIRLGVICWAGFAAPLKFVDSIFGKRGQKVMLIESGYHLVSFIVMGAIIGGWRP